MQIASCLRSIFGAVGCYILKRKGGRVISMISVILVSFELGNPALSSMLPNTIVGFFEKNEEIRETYKVKAGTELTAANANGDILLEAWNRDYVEVSAVKKTHHGEDELTKVQVEVVVGDITEIQTRYHEQNARVSVDYSIIVPRGLIVKKLYTSNGDIELNGPGVIPKS
jgi:hypothetical protein